MHNHHAQSVKTSRSFRSDRMMISDKDCGCGSGCGCGCGYIVVVVMEVVVVMVVLIVYICFFDTRCGGTYCQEVSTL